MYALTKEELAARLNGREYGDEIFEAEEQLAKQQGLVVVFGASDDLCEFRGAIHDEAGCYNGGDITFDIGGVLESWENLDKDEEDDVALWMARKGASRVIKAIWGGPDYSWQYDTEIPCASFDVMEDGEKYCKGIVFNLHDIAK